MIELMSWILPWIQVNTMYLWSTQEGFEIWSMITYSFRICFDGIMQRIVTCGRDHEHRICAAQVEVFHILEGIFLYGH
jgi:hypothetical protein